MSIREEVGDVPIGPRGGEEGRLVEGEDIDHPSRTMHGARASSRVVRRVGNR